MKLSYFALTLILASCSSAPGPVTPKTPVERKMIGLLQKFDRWDEDGNGSLSIAELKPAEKTSGYSAEKIMDFYDTNHNGSISLKEAQAGYARAGEAEGQANQ
jgi:hypothetical protein